MKYSTTSIVIILLIVSGGIFCIIISLAQLMIKNKKIINFISSAIFFLYGTCILCDTRYRTGTENITPHLLYINYPLLLLLGPTIFFYFRMLVSDRLKIKLKDLLLFFPGLFALIYFIPFYIQNAQTKLILYPLSSNSNLLIRYSYNIIDYSLMGWILLCFILSFRYTYFLWNKTTLKNIRIIRIILIYIIIGIVFMILLVYSDVTDNFLLYKAGLLFSNIFMITLVFMNYRYPDFFSILRKETSKVKYTNSQVKGLNIGAVIERINELMEYEKIYSDENLNLNKFSDILGITAHQLSEIINKNLNTNFNSFINNYRINAAKKMLADNTDYNILSVAFHCGFNSKTTFNTVFLKVTGMSPSNYRENHKKK